MTNKLTIIMYHYVRDLTNSKYPEIKGLDVKLFIKQIDHLAKNHTFIKAEDLITAIYHGKALPKNPVLLTFDDAYKDHYEYVFPILFQKGIQGSFYPPVRAITKNLVLDVNKIHFILAASPNKERLLKLVFSQLKKYRNTYNLKSDSYYFNKLGIANRFDPKEIIFIKRLLQVELAPPIRKLITDNLFHEILNEEETEFSKKLYLSAEELSKMYQNSMHIGSHGYDHFWLSSLEKNEQEYELQQSITFLKMLGVDMNYLSVCYPYGDYNADTLSIAKKLGFKLGFTTESKKCEVGELNIKHALKLPRLDTNDINIFSEKIGLK